MMNKIAIACDFAIIPLPVDNSLNYWKPENKLIHMWRMSLPTITSNIPSYSMVMQDSNQNLFTNDLEEWRSLILNFSTSKSLRKNHGLLGKKYVDKLPEALKTAFTLRESEGKSYEEISMITETPIGTVRSRIFRARENILTYISENL